MDNKDYKLLILNKFDKLEKKIHDLLEVVGSEPAIGEVKKDFHTHIKDSLYKILNIKVE